MDTEVPVFRERGRGVKRERRNGRKWGREKKERKQRKDQMGELMLVAYAYGEVTGFASCAHTGTHVFRIRKGS